MDAPKAKATLTFALYQGGDLLRRDSITQDIIKVGKDPKSHLRVEDDLASRMHAVIEVASPEDVTLIDLGNEPGTKVNGAGINKCKIRPGDEIEIGGTKIVFESSTAPVAKAAAPAPAASPSGSNPFASAPAAAAASNPFGGAAAGSNPFGAAASNPFGSGNPFAFQSSNPFAATPAADVGHTGEVPADAAPGTYTYSLIKSGPDVNPDEVEVSNVAAVEVMILWDTTVLHVEHLSPSKSFYIGEEEGKNVKCDYFIPSEKLGTTRAPLVLSSGGTTYAVLLPRAKGTIELPGQPKIPIAELIASGRAQACPELSGAHQIALTSNARVRLEIDGLVFQVASVAAGKKVPTALFAAASLSVFLFVGLSFLVHAGFLAGMAFFKPTLSATDDDEARKEQQLMMQQFLKNAAEREQEQKPEEQQQAAEDKSGGTGTKAKAEEGAMGNPNTKAQGMKYGVKGPADNPDPHIARQAALKEAAEFGMIGLLAAGVAGDPNSPTAPWGRDTASGTDSKSALGNMWGGDIGDSFGAGGLGLSGIGEGGGGTGEGIGLGNIGTLGRGAGTGSGQGFGSGSGRVGGDHKTVTPQVRVGGTSVSGKLPPEVVQRIVRQNFGRFRMCYENGLKNNPTLAGRVSVRFVIGRDGAVASVGNGGSDLPDSGVVNCVIRSFSGLSFPAPDGGIVTVTYPISFSPGS